MYTLIVTIFMTFLASIIGTLSGFGIGTSMTVILILFMPLPQVVLLVGIVHWLNSIWKIVFFKKYILWDIFIGFGIPAFIASFLGALLVGKAGDILLIMLGAFLIAYSFFVIFRPHFKVPYTKKTMIGGGLVTGFMAGIFGIRGAVRAVFLSALNLPKESYIGTIGAISCVVDSIRLITYIASGIRLHSELTIGLLMIVPVSFMGAYIGRYFIYRIPQKYFRIVVALFLLLVGIKLIVAP